MNKIHFMYVPMTGLGLYDGYRGDEWLEYRIDIFKRFVLNSLMAQSKKEFMVWFSWRPEEKENFIVKRFIKTLDGLRGMRFIHTFHGVCFYDDKYDDKVAEKRLKSSLEGSLKDLEEYVPFDTDVVYMTIQPSDDMYFPYVVEDIQNTFVANRAIGYKNGYINDYHTKEIAEYNPDTNPPFFTIMFPRDIFLDYEKHYSYTGPYKSHEHIKNIMQYDLFEKKGYIVGTHGRNISTVYNHPWKGRILSKEENENIQISTNTFFVDPIPYKSSKSLVLRKIFNALPFNNLIRSLYHKLPANLRKL